MHVVKNAELILGTFVDLTAKKRTSLNGSDICFVLVVDDFQEFIDKHTKSSPRDTVVLMRKKVSTDVAKDFLDVIKDYKVPLNNRWYYINPIKKTLEAQKESFGHRPELYKSKKKLRIHSN